MIEAPPWTAYGACVGRDTDIFFPDAKDRVEIRKAKMICTVCPVVRECREFAMRDSSLDGIWGGTTASERKDARRAHPRNSPMRPV